MQPSIPTVEKRRSRSFRLTPFALQALLEDALAHLRFTAHNGTDQEYLDALESVRLCRINIHRREQQEN